MAKNAQVNDIMISELYNAGNSVSDIVKMLAISDAGVRKSLKRSKIVLRKMNMSEVQKKAKQHSTIKLDHKALVDRYVVDKKSLAELSELFGVSIGVVARNLRENNINIRSHSEQNTIRVTETINTNPDYYKNMSKNISVETRDLIREKVTGRKIKFKNKKKWLENVRKAASRNWECDEYRKKVIDTLRNTPKEVMAGMSKKFWSNCDMVNQWRETISSDDHKLSQSALAMALWNNEEYKIKMNSMKKKLSEHMVEKWKDPEYKEKMLKSTKFVSSIESACNSILSDLGFNPFKKFHNGFEYDICIERDGSKKGLLIEVNGTYFHKDNKNDNLKKENYNSFLSNDYDFVVIEDFKFESKHKVYDIIIKSLSNIGYTFNKVNYNIHDSEIHRIDSDSASFLYKKYHYLKSRRHGISYGMYINKTLVASITYSGVTRQESAKRLGVKHNEVLEISRLCINPLYSIDNSLSYFISKTLKMVKNDFKNIKYIITFADQTVGHTGSIYKACNFISDGETTSSYYYESDGYYWHKKTIWDTAKVLNITESEFANLFLLNKVDTLPKFRFLYKF